MRRTIAVAVACAAGLLLAGCHGGAPSGAGTPSLSGSSPSTSPSPDVSHTGRIAARLTAAAGMLSRTSFRYDGGSGIVRMTGAFDPSRGVGDTSGSFGVGSGDVRVLGSDLYISGLAEPPTVWLRVDVDRLAPGNILTAVITPTVSTGYLAFIESATRTGPGRYTGALDVDRLTARAARSARAGVLLKLLGPNPTTATFDARTDAAGRLTELSITVADPDTPASTTVSTRYYDFGTPVRVARPPAARVADAPDELYTALAPTPNPTPSSSAG